MKSEYRKYYRELGFNVSYYRRMNNMTQEQLAEKVNLDQTTISKIEVASSAMSLDTLFALADLFGIPPKKFLEFRD